MCLTVIACTVHDSYYDSSSVTLSCRNVLCLLVAYLNGRGLANYRLFSNYETPVFAKHKVLFSCVLCAKRTIECVPQKGCEIVVVSICGLARLTKAELAILYRHWAHTFCYHGDTEI